MDFQQINVSSSAPSLLAGQNQGPVLLFNASQDTAVWLGSDSFNTVAGDTSSTAQLPPLASVVIDGSQSVYGSCLPGQSAQVSVIPGGLNFFQLVEILVKTLLISASTGNGLFVYSGAPALGNLIASIVASATNDPFGNPVGAGFNIGNQSGGAHFGVAPNGNVFISNSLGQNVIQIHPDLGAVLLYSGLPAAGNLICSVASADGTDPQNNAFLAGTTTYGPGGIGFTATQLENGIINFWQALTEAGPWTPTGTIACNGSIFLNCNQFVIPEVPIVPLDPRNPATEETWHYVGAAGEPAFGAAWANAGGSFAPLAFRRLASPANEVEIKGTIATTAAAPNNNIFTLPAVGYVPANSQRFGQSTAAVPAAACNIQVASGTGIVQVSNAPGGVATTIGVDIRVSLDL